MMKQRSNRFVLQREMKNEKGWDESMGTMPERIAKYQIRGVIGTGGMAKVYRAYDKDLDREVALKVLSENYSGKSEEEEIERFLREARISAKIEHPNVVPIYEVGSDNRGHYFIAMKLIEGETLGDKIRQKGCFEAGEAIEIVMVVCAALSEAHRHGVVHRDIKPMNVMIDVKGHIYVADFGIAKSLRTSSIDKTQLMGTPTYMPPERCKGQSGDARSDLYSLGVVMYEMLVGTPPFIADNPLVVMRMHEDKEPEPPRSRNGQIPGWLNSVVMRLLAKNPGSRFQSCGELVEALRERMTVPIPRASRKWLMIGLQGVAAVIVGVMVVVWLNGKPNQEALPPPVVEVTSYLLAGEGREKQGDYYNASIQYGLALASAPENKLAQDGKERSGRKLEVSKYVTKGRESENAGDYPTSKEAYQEALKLEPENREAAAGIKRCESRQKVTLRSKPTEGNLTVGAVKSMLQRHNFYCKEYTWSKEWCNPKGTGFQNNYEKQSKHGVDVVVDHASGLMWQQSGSNQIAFGDAKNYVDRLNRDTLAGYHDWRLPTLEEAMSLMEPTEMNGNLYIDPKFDKMQSWIWTSDTYSASSVWVVDFGGGGCYGHGVDYNGYDYVRAVR